MRCAPSSSYRAHFTLPQVRSGMRANLKHIRPEHSTQNPQRLRTTHGPKMVKLSFRSPVSGRLARPSSRNEHRTQNAGRAVPLAWSLEGQMRRREFIKLVGGAAVAWPLSVRAENSRKIPRIGVLWHAGSAAEEGRYFTGFVDGLRGLGYLEGTNIVLEHRFPNEMPDRFRNMAAELVSLNVDVLVSVGSQTAFYAWEATRTIPIVFIFVPDPVGSKFVMSLARPGGNATGLTHFAADLIGKRLEFLKETSPGLARVGLLVNPDTEVARLYTHVTDSMAQKLGLSNHTFSARSRD